MHESQALAAALNQTLASHAPGWTNHNDADPGVTILEVIAWLAEGLVYRGRIEGGASAVKRTLAALTRLDTVRPAISVTLVQFWSGTKRPNYFPGKLLSPDDFTQEQNYLLEKHRRHLRTLHGFGIVHGLHVGVDETGATIAIEPGLAIDRYGRELSLSEHLTITVPAGTSSPSLVTVEYTERFVDPVPAAEHETPQPSRIEEGCRIALVNDACEDGVVVARLLNKQNRWHIDPIFVPARAR
jgi:hypothetical protein